MKAKQTWRTPRHRAVGRFGTDGRVYYQHDRAEIQVIATGRGQRRWVVDYSVIELALTILDTYPALNEYLRVTWKTTQGIDMPITTVALDGGNWTETAAQFVKQLVNQSGQARIVETPNGYIKQTVYPIRERNGRRSERALYRSAKTDANTRNKTVARSVSVWGGTSVLKTIVYGWLSAALTAKGKAEAERQAEDLTARMLHFPGGRGSELPDPINQDQGSLMRLTTRD